MDGQRSDSLTGNWDTRISRRVLLRTGGSAAAGLLLLGRAAYSASAAPPHAGNPFSLGIASGDPTPQASSSGPGSCPRARPSTAA